MEPLDDRELDQVLRQWRAPDAPARLRSAIFPEERVPWWRRSVRIPLPVAACLAVLLALGLWRWIAPRERVEIPASAVKVVAFQELRPVTELKPRLIRRGHGEN